MSCLRVAALALLLTTGCSESDPAEGSAGSGGAGASSGAGGERRLGGGERHRAGAARRGRGDQRDGGGGTLRFDCGGPHTITLTSSVYVTKTMLLDGGGTITLSGGGAVRVIELTTTSTSSCSGSTIRDGYVAAGSENESGAGLLHPWFGTLEAIDVGFRNNHSESKDHDVGGGAIYAGGLTRAVLSGCVFEGNSGSTGGGVLSRSTNLEVSSSVFRGNTATTYAESGQYGNGGGLYIDRMWLDAPIDFVICGSVFDSNHAQVHGSALFSYNLEGSRAVVDRCTFRDNDMAGSPGGAGSVYHEGVRQRGRALGG